MNNEDYNITKLEKFKEEVHRDYRNKINPKALEFIKSVLDILTDHSVQVDSLPHNQDIMHISFYGAYIVVPYSMKSKYSVRLQTRNYYKESKTAILLKNILTANVHHSLEDALYLISSFVKNKPEKLIKEWLDE